MNLERLTDLPTPLLDSRLLELTNNLDKIAYGEERKAQVQREVTHLVFELTIRQKEQYEITQPGA